MNIKLFIKKKKKRTEKKEKKRNRITEIAGSNLSIEQLIKNKNKKKVN